MKIEQLQQLLKIVEEGSINEAAKELYIARSSLSTSMKNLERELGAQIFSRNSKGVCLTDFGADVYSQAKDICSKIDFIQSVPYEEDRMNLSISSMYCSLANDAFVELYQRHFRDNFTGSIEECTLNEVIRQVNSGLSEIGMVTLFSDSESVALKKIADNHLEFHKLIDRKLHAIIGPKNPLYAEERSSVGLDDLKDFPYIVNYASPSDYSWERTLDGRKRKRAEIHVSDLGCALRLINATEAIMIDTYDKDTYAQFYAPNGCKFIPLADSPLACKLGWVKSENKTISKAAEEFIAIINVKASYGNF
ncbi:LysR family transcriptional regulator [Emergencia timonensis]|uniref:LysR family transcriptional regulator n=1 Tax=Emergencia timonensis TaxID=1776384 RepID=UPI003992075E